MSSNISSAKTQSTTTFVTALWLNAVIFAIEIIAFTLLRRKFRSIYEPRTFIPIEAKRSQPLSARLFGWPLALFKTDYRSIKYQNGMDAYFFVRFLRLMVKILVPIWLISWVVLLPVNSIKTKTGHTGLDMFSFGNIGPTVQSRYAAHLILAYLFTGWIWYNIKREMRNFITERQQHLVDPLHSSSAQANTILVTGIPTKYMTEPALIDLFSYLPGGVRKVWLNRDLKELPKLYERRLKACNKLEAAETRLIKLALKFSRKQSKKGDSSDLPVNTNEAERMSLSRAESVVPTKKRPSHRLPAGFIPFSLPLIGKKVDSITWAREEIERTTAELEAGRAVIKNEVIEEFAAQRRAAPKSNGFDNANSGHASASGNIRTEKTEDKQLERGLSPSRSPTIVSATEPTGDSAQRAGTYPALNSAFILFHNQVAAHMAAQVLAHHEPYRMSEKYVQVAPADVLWGNLGLNPYEAKIRLIVSYAITAVIIIFWAIPVAFVGAVSNVGNLCSTYSWLSWLCKLPSVVIGILQGFLPPVLLAVLMMLLPVMLRKLSSFEGVPTRTGVELSLMTRYFLFQVIHSFLIVTISSGIIAALPELVNNPSSIPTLLATNLPQASNFFLTYIVLQGLTGIAGGFLQAAPLVLYYVKLKLLGSTPRSVYKIKYTLRSVSWGTLFPATTLIAVITITYSIISPIINGLACVAFFFFYMLWKYLFLYTYDQPVSGDTGGLFFPKAIQHIFVGMYIQQICLAALFFLAQDENKKQSAIPEGALMVVLIICTALFHMAINNSYGPLRRPLPLSLASKANGMVQPQPSDDTFSGTSTTVNTREKDARRSSISSVHRKRAPGAAAERETAGKAPVRTAADYEAMRSVPVEGKHSLVPHMEPQDFYHPASVEPLRVIWLPRDAQGFFAGEEADNRALGIDASSEHSVMNEKGIVDVDGRPPGMNSYDM